MFEILKEYWEEPMLNREELELLSGGVITDAMLKRFDMTNEGIANRTIIRKKTYYQLDAAIKWLNEHTREV